MSFNDIAKFLDWLSRATGREHFLPTEAEWEYAASIGARGRYLWGDEATPDYANYQLDTDQANYSAAVKATRLYAPSPTGLFDLHGNVWEFVADCWLADAGRHRPRDGGAVDAAFDSVGADCGYRVLKGGSWASRAPALRRSFRIRARTDRRDEPWFGFRPVRYLESTSELQEVIVDWTR